MRQIVSNGTPHREIIIKSGSGLAGPPFDGGAAYKPLKAIPMKRANAFKQVAIEPGRPVMAEFGVCYSVD